MQHRVQITKYSFYWSAYIRIFKNFHSFKSLNIFFQAKKNMAENSISWKICSTWTPNEPQFEFSKLSSNFEGRHLAVRRCNWSKAANCYSLFLTTGQRSLSSQWGKLISYYFTVIWNWEFHSEIVWKVLACLLWKYGLWSFQAGGTKLERFLHNNQHTQRKLLNFEFWINGELSKIGHHFSNKVI